MLQRFLIIASVITLIAVSCAVPEAVQTKRDIERLMPPVPPSFSHKDSVRLIQNWTIGIRMYKANCARCHGIFGNSKDTIPNFSQVQFDDYNAAFLAGDSLNHAVMAKMTPEELSDVFLFLTNIKRDEHNKVVKGK